MAQNTSNSAASLHVSATYALIATLCLLSGARALLHGLDDSLRAASYFLRHRRSPAVSLLRLDQQPSNLQELSHVLACARRR